MDAKRVNKPVMYDPLIIPRVKQYLEENVHQTYVDVGVMARHLQEKYREYNRRKAQPFRQLVDQAYRTVLHSYGLDSNPSSEDDENSDVELMDNVSRIPTGNHMNNMLTDMYNAGGKTLPSQNPGEAIDISSDDDDDVDSAPKTKTNNVGQNAEAEFNKLQSGSSNKIKGLITKPLSGELLVSTSCELQQNISKKRKIESRRESTNDVTNHKSTKDSNPFGRLSKKLKREFAVTKSSVTFQNIGGIDKILKELCELLLHIKHPNVYKYIGLPPPRGFLLLGPPGCGKTLLAQAIAGQLQIDLMQVAATELIGGVSGESEERIRDLFDQAASAAPCVLFIDEIDAISSNRLNAQKDMERRIVSQLLICLDNLSKHEKGDQVLVIGATNRADSIDPALRRVGRFDQEICLGIPDREARCEILRVICNNLRLEKMFDYEKIAALTPGYVGADLLALATRAASLAVKRIFHVKQENILLGNALSTKETIMLPDVNLSEDVLMSDLDTIEETKDENKGENEEKIESAKQNGENIEDESKTNNEEKVEEIESGISDQKPDENEKMETIEPDITSNKIVNKEVIETDEKNTTEENNETLGEALLKNNAIKQQMGLDVMFKWLSNTEQLVSEEELKELFITMDDFNQAIKIVQPSAKREGFITVPDVTWDDIGSLRDIRQELNLAILAPVKFPNRLKSLGLEAPSGVLLCGPPGCGKTLLAKAIANEAGINFISVKGPELLNMYVGESERAVRQCFQRARNSAPCVIFFDEFDALCPKRSGSSEGSASSRVVNQLLTEMDGIEGRRGVFLMAATNRPDMVDPAVLRPGRLDKILYVGLPEQPDRFEILEALTKKGKEPPLSDDVSLEELSKLTESYTGADLAGLVRQASLQALKDSLLISNESELNLTVNKEHFKQALKQLRPSVSADDKVRYEKLRIKYAAVPGN